MSADGSWSITLTTPMGPQQFTADLKTDGGTLTGTVESPLGSDTIEGTVDGDVLAWSIKVDKPMPIQVDFDVVVNGDDMNGSAKLGMFGSGDVTGHRV